MKKAPETGLSFFLYPYQFRTAKSAAEAGFGVYIGKGISSP
jgi:hypothetical protein